MSAVPAAPPVADRFSPRLLVAFVLPLFFVLLMAATFVTALHRPVPHDLALTVAGPATSTAPVAAGVQRQAPGAFDVTVASTAAEARTAVLRRDAVGAVVLGGARTSPTVTVYVANAGGRSAASAVTAVGNQIAAQLGTTATVTDLAPLTPGDELGTGVFYLVVFGSIGGYLTMIVLTQVAPRARLSRRYLTALISAVLTPPLVIGLASIFLGDLGLSFGGLVAVLGVLALYVFTVGLVVVLANQLLGASALYLVAPIAIFGNLASAGGASPESMLPGFWQALHAVWFGAGANEALRDIVYFPGANPIRWIVQLLVWTLVLLVVTLFIHGMRVIWRLQTVVIRSRHQVDTLTEHVHLMSIPQQPRRTAGELTSSTVTSSTGVSPAETAPARDVDDGRSPDDEDVRGAAPVHG